MQRASIDGVRFNRTGVYRVRCARSIASTGQCTYKARTDGARIQTAIPSLAVTVFEVFSNIVEQGCPHSSIFFITHYSLFVRCYIPENQRSEQLEWAVHTRSKGQMQTADYTVGISSVPCCGFPSQTSDTVTSTLAQIEDIATVATSHRNLLKILFRPS